MKERRKLSGKILTVLLTVMLLVTSMAVSVPAALRITIRDGKVYQNNKPVTNKIVGSKAKGYYYVDKTGRKVNTREIRQAVDFVMRNSKQETAGRNVSKPATGHCRLIRISE